MDLGPVVLGSITGLGGFWFHLYAESDITDIYGSVWLDEYAARLTHERA